MKIQEHIIAKWDTCIPTEFTAYKTLKNKNISNPIIYLAVPWALILNSIVPNDDRFEGLKINGGFTICQHINYVKIIPLLEKIGIDTLFTPHVNTAKDSAFKNISVLPFPHYAANGAKPSRNKTILYSFIGATRTHPIRDEILKLKPPKSVFHSMLFWKKDQIYIKKRKVWHFARNIFEPNCMTAKQQKKEKNEYQTVLSKSRFSLCPEGAGPSTVRFWESLQAGAIPILIGDSMLLPKIKEIDWANCTVRIKERDLPHLKNILAQVKNEAEMRLNCLKAYKLVSGKNFTKCIEEWLEENSAKL